MKCSLHKTYTKSINTTKMTANMGKLAFLEVK